MTHSNNNCFDLTLSNWENAKTKIKSLRKTKKQKNKELSEELGEYSINDIPSKQSNKKKHNNIKKNRNTKSTQKNQSKKIKQNNKNKNIPKQLKNQKMKNVTKNSPNAKLVVKKVTTTIGTTISNSNKSKSTNINKSKLRKILSNNNKPKTNKVKRKSKTKQPRFQLARYANSSVIQNIQTNNSKDQNSIH